MCHNQIIAKIKYVKFYSNYSRSFFSVDIDYTCKGNLIACKLTHEQKDHDWRVLIEWSKIWHCSSRLVRPIMDI